MKFFIQKSLWLASWPFFILALNKERASWNHPVFVFVFVLLCNLSNKVTHLAGSWADDNGLSSLEEECVWEGKNLIKCPLYVLLISPPWACQSPWGRGRRWVQGFQKGQVLTILEGLLPPAAWRWWGGSVWWSCTPIFGFFIAKINCVYLGRGSTKCTVAPPSSYTGLS